MRNKQNKIRLNAAGGLLAILILSSVALSVGVNGNASSQTSLLAVETVKNETSVKENKKKTNKKKATKQGDKKKKSAGKFKATKKNCALAAKWAAAGTYTPNVLKRGWPHTDDLNGDGAEEHVVEVLCNRAGFPVSF